MRKQKPENWKLKLFQLSVFIFHSVMDFLVIDDDKTFRDATCILIDGEGHYAEGAAVGSEGLERLKADRFDAVLLDVNLAEESGLDLLPQIVKSYPNLPVVMCTAQGNVKTAVEAMRRGAADFLEKPFDPKIIGILTEEILIGQHSKSKTVVAK